MLSKDVCVKCWMSANKSAAQLIAYKVVWLGKRRKVSCPHRYNAPYTVDTGGPPPDWCTYKFEHAAAEHIDETH